MSKNNSNQMKTSDADEDLSSTRLMNRRRALSTVGRVAIGAAAVIIVGGVAYYAGTQTAAPAPAETITQTVTQSVTTTVTQTASPTITTTRGAVQLDMFASSGMRFGWVLEKGAELYQAKTPGLGIPDLPYDVTITVDTVPIGDFFAKSAVLLEQGSKYEVLLIDPIETPRFAEAKVVIPLDDYLDPAWKADYVNDVPEAMRTIGQWKGKTYCLTSDSNCQFSFYRKDKFEEFGQTLPKDWEEVPEVAKAMTDESIPQYGFTSSFRRGSFAGWSFQSIFWSFGGRWFDDDWNPTLNSPEGIRALEVLVECFKYADPSAINATDDETINAMTSGVAVYAPIQWGNSVLTNPELNQFADVTETAVPPMGAGHKARPIAGSLQWTIPATAEFPEEAATFLKWYCGGDINWGREYVKATGQPARRSFLTDPENVKLGKYFPTLSKALDQVHLQLLLPEVGALTETLGTAVSFALTGEKTVKQALDDANEKVREIMKAGGYYEKKQEMWFEP